MQTEKMSHRDLFLRMFDAIETSQEPSGSMSTSERRQNTDELHACMAELGGRAFQMFGSIADAANMYTLEMKRQREEREATKAGGYTGRPYRPDRR